MALPARYYKLAFFPGMMSWLRILGTSTSTCTGGSTKRTFCTTPPAFRKELQSKKFQAIQFPSLGDHNWQSQNNSSYCQIWSIQYFSVLFSTFQYFSVLFSTFQYYSVLFSTFSTFSTFSPIQFFCHIPSGHFSCSVLISRSKILSSDVFW